MGISVKRLGDIAEITPGVAEDKIKDGVYKYLCYQPNSLSETDISSCLPIIYRNEPLTEKQIVKNEDVIIKRLNHDRAYIASDLNEAATISQNLFILRSKDEICLSGYLAFLFEQHEVLSLITQVSGSSAPIRALSAKILAEIPIPIVPIERQRIISDFWKLSKRRKALLHALEFENSRLMTAIYKNHILRG